MPTNDSEPKISDEHDELFHYTTEAGLLGILNTQQLWAVRYDSMNDPTEFRHINGLLIDEIRPDMKEFLQQKRKSSERYRRAIIDHGGINNVVDIESRRWIESVHHALVRTRDGKPRVLPYVTSFCTHDRGSYEERNGLLSQWRGYGGTQPYALVFDAKKLEPIIDCEYQAFHYYAMFMVSVAYDGPDFNIRTRFPKLTEGVFESWKKMFTHGSPGMEEVVEPLVKTSVRIKHQGFREENEIRLVAIPKLPESAVGEALKPERIKPIAIEPKPHVSLFGGSIGELPIRRIIVGPSRDMPAAMEFAMELAAGRFEVVGSETPYLPPH